ncbi:MAG: hypothetical protein DCC74_08810 [Proteobacteria bacterium]|nr:MAG: hypothetical protein DCC74_08810 [Pseudomonadota bacterium]
MLPSRWSHVRAYPGFVTQAARHALVRALGPLSMPAVAALRGRMIRVRFGQFERSPGDYRGAAEIPLTCLAPWI